MEYFLDRLALEPSIPQFRPKLRVSTLWREILETLIFVIAVYALVELAMPRFQIDGPSMQPNFHNDQRLVVSRLHYMFGEPEPGDIGVFNAPGSGPGDPPLIKRVIGVPFDTVEIRDTKFFINGVQLNEPYTNGDCSNTRCPDDVWQLAENEYFFAGDNRNRSRDSRSFGPIKRENVIGEAVVRFWPPTDIGIITKIAYPSD